MSNEGRRIPWLVRAEQGGSQDTKHEEESDDDADQTPQDDNSAPPDGGDDQQDDGGGDEQTQPADDGAQTDDQGDQGQDQPDDANDGVDDGDGDQPKHDDGDDGSGDDPNSGSGDFDMMAEDGDIAHSGVFVALAECIASAGGPDLNVLAQEGWAAEDLVCPADLITDGKGVAYYFTPDDINNLGRAIKVGIEWMAPTTAAEGYDPDAVRAIFINRETLRFTAYVSAVLEYAMRKASDSIYVQMITVCTIGHAGHETKWLSRMTNSAGASGYNQITPGTNNALRAKGIPAPERLEPLAKGASKKAKKTGDSLPSVGVSAAQEGVAGAGVWHGFIRSAWNRMQKTNAAGLQMKNAAPQQWLEILSDIGEADGSVIRLAAMAYVGAAGKSKNPYEIGATTGTAVLHRGAFNFPAGLDCFAGVPANKSWSSFNASHKPKKA